MRNLFVIVFLFLYACANVAPVIEPDPGPHIVITPLSYGESVVVAGAPGQSLVGYAFENRSTRPIDLVSQTVTVIPQDAMARGNITESSVVALTLFDQAGNQTVMGPASFDPTTEIGHDAQLVLADTLVVPPGTRLVLMLRAGIAHGIEGRYTVTLGEDGGPLLPSLRYADDGGAVPDALVVGNVPVEVDVRVIDPDAMPIGDAVLVTRFVSRVGMILPDTDGADLGDLCLHVYGGTVHLGEVEVAGPNTGAFESLHLNDAAGTSHATGPVSPSETASITFGSEELSAGPERCFTLHGDYSFAQRSGAYYGEIVSLRVTQVIARGEGGGTVEVIPPNPDSSFFIFRLSKPDVALETLGSHAITNFRAMELMSPEIADPLGRPVYVGSMTVRVTGLGSGRSLSNFSLRTGSTVPAADACSIRDTATGLDLTDGTLESASGTAQFTVTCPRGLRLPFETGLTVSAVPMGFVAGDSIHVSFGDRSYPTINSGALMTDGRLNYPGAITPVIDALVWSDDPTRGLWVGASFIEGLDVSETFVM